MPELKSKEVPLLFKGHMVRALIRKENPKQVTRRIADQTGPVKLHKKGDLIWVKETFQVVGDIAVEPCDRKYLVYKATFPNCAWKGFENVPAINEMTWRPSLFMPRWASRITLEVTQDAWAERLQNISEESALAEGFIKLPDGRVVEYAGAEEFGFHWPNAIEAYRSLWNDINLVPKSINKNKHVLSFVSYPWCNADFDAEYPGIRELGVFRSKPIEVIENPLVTVTPFKLKELRT